MEIEKIKEIKKALGNCQKNNCIDCPYFIDEKSCRANDLLLDTISYINELESKCKSLTTPKVIIHPKSPNIESIAVQVEKYGFVDCNNYDIELIPTRAEIEKETAKEILDEVSKRFGGKWLVELYKKYNLDWNVEVE